jgi:hypothetical protein
MTAESWRAIPGYGTFYEASDAGRIRSLTRSYPDHPTWKPRPGRILKQFIHRHYPTVDLSINGRVKHWKVANLVALTFIGPKPFPTAHVCHGNGDKRDSSLTNLRYDSASGNRLDDRRNGTDYHVNLEKCPAGHDYNDENTYVVPATGHRQCRPCKNARMNGGLAGRTPPKHGTGYTYRAYKCRCPECLAAEVSHNAKKYSKKKARNDTDHDQHDIDQEA